MQGAKIHTRKRLPALRKTMPYKSCAVVPVTACWVDVSFKISLSSVIFIVAPKQENQHFISTKGMEISHMLLSLPAQKECPGGSRLSNLSSCGRERAEMWGHVSNWALQSKVCLQEHGGRIHMCVCVCASITFQ